MQVNVRAHLVHGTSNVIIEMGVRKMKSQVSSFRDYLGSLLHLLIHRLLVGLLHHGLLNNDHLL
jgi:hypothetical protein